VCKINSYINFIITISLSVFLCLFLVAPCMGYFFTARNDNRHRVACFLGTRKSLRIKEFPVLCSMTLEHQNINVGDRIYSTQLDEICVVKYKDSASLMVQPILANRLPVRVKSKDGKYEGLKSWYDFVRAERNFENYTP
jgi:hypothetical protein